MDHSVCAATATRWLWLTGAALALGPVGQVAADGAFADSQVILLPATQPQRILASSDVPGLIVSDDGGQSWSWICENAVGVFATLFQLGPAPEERLYAVARKGLTLSADAGCTWHYPGEIAQHAGDVFPDPSDAQRVLIVSQTTLADDKISSDVIVASSDGGESFGPPLFATSTQSITGIEIARSDPARHYLTMSSLELQHPYLARSRDRGASWDALDLSHQLGRRPFILRIVTIDPSDPDHVYLRLSDGVKDGLGISRDGGDHVQLALQLDASMTAFLLRKDGSLIVASSDGQAFSSHDGGDSFTPWPENASAFHIRALAERGDGRIYAAANSKLDGFAFAASDDDGVTWQPLLKLPDLQGPLQCGSIPALCDMSWSQLRPSLPALSGQAQRSEPDAGTGVSVPAQRVRGSGGCSTLHRSDAPDLSSDIATIACVWQLCRRRRSRGKCQA